MRQRQAWRSPRAKACRRPGRRDVNTPHESRLGWYARRLARMSPAEVLWRAHDKAFQVAWVRRQVHREQIARDTHGMSADRRVPARLSNATGPHLPPTARAATPA